MYDTCVCVCVCVFVCAYVHVSVRERLCVIYVRLCAVMVVGNGGVRYWGIGKWTHKIVTFKMCFRLEMHITMCAGSFLASHDSGRMVNHSFPAGDFVFFFSKWTFAREN